jgi:membrane associated rhomboid family serine protease
MIRQLLPGVVLPGVLYFTVARFGPQLVALAAASSVPLLDAAARLLRGKRPTPVSLVVLGFAGLSVGLAMGLRSPMFILAKGAVLSGALGIAFGVSGAIRRPLVRTIAIMLAAETVIGRRSVAKKWGHPRTMAVFRTLSVGWGILLVLSAIQQLAMVLNVSPGTVMAAEPALQALVTISGTAISIMYVRRLQNRHPELGLLPERSG